MFSLPELVLVHNDQVVPDVDRPWTLDKTFPVVHWNGRRIEFFEYMKVVILLDNNCGYSDEQKRALKSSFLSIFGRAISSCPGYFRQLTNNMAKLAVPVQEGANHSG